MTDSTITDDLQTSETQVLAGTIATGGIHIDELDLTPEAFWSPANADLWSLLVDMRDRGMTIDFPAVIAEANGKIPGLATTYTALVTPGSAPYHADRVRAAYAVRRVCAAATRLAQTAQDTRDAALAVENARAELDAISASIDTTTGLRSTADEIDRVLEDTARPGRFYSTPWDSLNHLIVGLTPGRVYVAAARPGCGKSIFGLQVATHFQREHGLSTAFSSLEMDYDEVTLRSLSQMSGIDFKRLQTGQIADLERRALDKAVDSLRSMPRIYVDDRTMIRPVDVRSHARNVSRRGNLGLIVVDYIGLMESGNRNTENRQVEVAGFSRAMKRMAREMNVPVIVLSQLNRQVEGRNSEPRLSDLRDSGAIEQDADVVILLHRENLDSDEVQVGVAKNRQGPRSGFTLAFEGSRMRMTERQWHPRSA